MKRIAVAGSTGSIGTQTLDIIAANPDRFRATVLTAGRNADLLVEQALRHRPALAVIDDVAAYRRVREALAPHGIETACGPEALADAMDRDDVDMVVTATVGYSGLAPTLRAITAGKDIALANKETLVVAGQLVTGLLRRSESRVYPVDSEHSAIYQCLVGEDPSTVERLVITASGGPFLHLDAARLSHVTAEQALRHPNWNMGAKITIDSATMLNKAFEIIEARWLFDIAPERITALVHPQSIVHSMVEFRDGAVKAQLGTPDMHLPIRYALGEASRLESRRPPLTLAHMASLTFEEPDLRRFPCLSLAHTALSRGGNAPCVINAANEIANAAFREGRIGFNDIYRIITDTLGHTGYIAEPTYADLVATNAEARARATEYVANTNICNH